MYDDNVISVYVLQKLMQIFSSNKHVNQHDQYSLLLNHVPLK